MSLLRTGSLLSAPLTGFLLSGLLLSGCALQPAQLAGNEEGLATDHTQQCVVLVHGLWRSASAMGSIAEYLEQSRFQTVRFSYPSTELDIPSLAENYLAPAVEQCEKTGSHSVHLVTHSMGGIVARAYLQNHRLPGEGKVVMISPPNQGSEISKNLGHLGWFKSLAGKAATTLTEEGVMRELKPFPEPVGVIAGYRTWSLWPESILPSPNDGMVSVASMPLEGMDDYIEVEGGHAMLRFKEAVKFQVKAFLDYGRFEKSLPESPLVGAR